MSLGWRVGQCIWRWERKEISGCGGWLDLSWVVNQEKSWITRMICSCLENFSFILCSADHSYDWKNEELFLST